MPIYEYLCHPCNRVFSFFSPTVDPDRKPTCPDCGGNAMSKRISSFAFVGRTRKSQTDRQTSPSDGPDGASSPGDDTLDDPRVEREMMKLMSDAEGIDEDDPRQLGRLMRRMSEITGEKLDGEMEEAVRRLESGEDPEKIEEDMGEALGDEEGGMGGGMGGMGAPSYDDGLHSF